MSTSDKAASTDEQHLDGKLDRMAAGLIAEPTGAPTFSEADGRWLVTRHDDVCQVLLDPVSFSNDIVRRPGKLHRRVLEVLLTGRPFNTPIAASDPPSHARRRKLLNAVFTTPRMTALEPQLGHILDEMVGRIEALAQVDLWSEFCVWVPMRVFGLMLGADMETLIAVRAWRRDWIRLAWYGIEVDDQVECARSVVAMQRHFMSLVEARRMDPRDDILSALVHASASAEDPFSDDELLAELFGLMEAGQETTSAAIANAVYYLLADRAQWTALCADPALAVNAVEEVLRRDSAIRGLLRTVTRDVEVGGVVIPAGAGVRVMLAAGGDRPTSGPIEITNPQSGRHLAFGRGIHYCIGAALARTQIRMALETLARRLPSLRLRAGAQYEYVGNPAFRIPVGLPVEWDTDDKTSSIHQHTNNGEVRSC